MAFLGAVGVCNTPIAKKKTNRRKKWVNSIFTHFFFKFKLSVELFLYLTF